MRRTGWMLAVALALVGASAWWITSREGERAPPTERATASASGQTAERALRGVVVDPNGDPVAGATVRAREQPLTRRAVGPDVAPVGETTTGANGAFALQLPTWRRYMLEVAHPDYATLHVGPFADDATATVRVTPAREIRGTVVGADGAPFPGALVTAQEDSRTASLVAPVITWASTRSDASGAYVLRVPQGMAYVGARARHGGTRILVPPGADAIELPLRLPYDRVSHGPVPAVPYTRTVDIRVVDRRSGAPVATAVARNPKNDTTVAQADADGRLEVPIGSSSMEVVFLSAPGFAPSSWLAYSRTIELEPGQRFHAQLRGGAARPYDVSVRVQFDATPWTVRRVLRAASDGRFAVSDVSAHGTVVVDVLVAPRQIVSRPHAGAIVDLEAGVVVHGRVEFPPGLARAAVTLHRGFEQTTTVTVTPEEPTFRFPGVVARDVRLTTENPGWPSITTRLQGLREDPEPVIVRFPKLRDVRLRVVHTDGTPARGARVSCGRLHCLSDVRGEVVLHVPTKRDACRVAVAAYIQGGRFVYLRHRVAAPGRHTIPLPGVRDVVGRLRRRRDTSYGRMPTTVEAWHLGRRVRATTVVLDNPFLLRDVPAGAELRAHGTWDGVSYEGRIESVAPGSYDVRIELQPK